MHKALIALVIAGVSLTACNKSKPKASDAFEQKLQDTAGSNATNCGRFQQEQADLKRASDCVMQAAQAKKPFYVAYDMPGLSVGVAGTSDGKLFTVQSEPGEQGKEPSVTAMPCPAELRVAQSGRVTCTPAGGMGMTMGGGSPHGGITMPPAGTANPHAGGEAPVSTHGEQQEKAKTKP
ncbi:MAG: hypothetical protein ACE14L_08890 [Terriglobales bacterium]